MTMYDYDTDFAPPALVGLGASTWIALVLGAVLSWGWIAALVWRMMA
jgi:hypothetical protein